MKKFVTWAALMLLCLTLSCGAAAADGAIEIVETAIVDETVTAEGGDNAALFSEYVDAVFSPNGITTRHTGADLTGVDRNIYDILSSSISEIAAGTRTSTVIGVSFADMGFEKLSYTAEELGVERVGLTDDEGKGYIAPEASEAFAGKFTFDLHNIYRSLILDSAYELYWHNKLQGVDTGGFSIYAEYDSVVDDYNLYVKPDDEVTFLFAVAQEYAAGEYMVDTSIAQAAVQSAENARQIAMRYGDLSDTEKLTAYRDEICALVEYNHDAADNDNTPYGNPWQLIWVFDGDAATNVVCEGYAKAFYYLCQLGGLTDSECYIVNGMMYGATGEGRHMWNIVANSDGTFMCDVTNSDEGSVGMNGGLFMALPADGSYDTQYIFDCDGASVKYEYDNDIFNLYSEDELTLRRASPKLQLTGTAHRTLAIGAPDGVVRFDDRLGTIYISDIDRVSALYDGEPLWEVTLIGSGIDVISQTDEVGALSLTLGENPKEPGSATLLIKCSWGEAVGQWQLDIDCVDAGLPYGVTVDTEYYYTLNEQNVFWPSLLPCEFALDGEDRYMTFSFYDEYYTDYCDVEFGDDPYAWLLTFKKPGTYGAKFELAYGNVILDASTRFVVTDGEPEILALPEDLTAIEAQAFYGTAADIVIINDKCASIGAAAFAQCKSLVEVIIPDSVTEIDATAFDGSDYVTIVTHSAYVQSYADANGIRWLAE